MSVAALAMIAIICHNFVSCIALQDFPSPGLKWHRTAVEVAEVSQSLYCSTVLLAAVSLLGILAATAEVGHISVNSADAARRSNRLRLPASGSLGR